MLSHDELNTAATLDLPVLPEGWIYRELGDLILPNGLSYGIVQPGSEDPDGVPILRVKNIRNGRVMADDVLHVARGVEEGYRRTRLSGGEVLLTLVGSVGEVAVAPSFAEGWNVARAIAVIRVDDSVASSWVKLCLSAELARQFMHVWQTTTVQATLNLRDVRRLPIILPPTREREAIAALIGALDDKIAVNDRIAACCNGLAYLQYQAVVDKAPEVPLSQLVDPILGGTPDRSVADYWGQGNPWASARDVTGAPFEVVVFTEEEITDYAVIETKAKPVPKGSVILTARGTVGAVARVGQPTSFNQSCYAFTPGRLPPAVLYLAVKSAAQRMLAVAHGTVFSTVTKKTFDHIYTPMVSHSEIQYLEGQLAPLLNIVECRVRESLSLAKLRDTLLPKLMSGEIRVRDAEKAVEDVT